MPAYKLTLYRRRSTGNTGVAPSLASVSKVTDTCFICWSASRWTTQHQIWTDKMSFYEKKLQLSDFNDITVMHTTLQSNDQLNQTNLFLQRLQGIYKHSLVITLLFKVSHSCKQCGTNLEWIFRNEVIMVEKKKLGERDE